MVASLEARAYRLVEEDYSEADFGNWSRVFAKRRLRVLIVRERGTWEVRVGFGSERWYLPGVWTKCLDGVWPALQVQSVADDAAFVITNLSRMEASAANPAFRSCLEERQRLLDSQTTMLPFGATDEDAGRLQLPEGKEDEQVAALRRLARERRARRTRRGSTAT